MSKDDIIKSWKGANDQRKGEPTPPSPVGDAELSDDALEQVAGGGTESAASIGCCTSIFCPPKLDEGTF